MLEVARVRKVEECIYNTHLQVSRQSRGKPYTLRKNFSNLDEETEIILNNISRFFSNNPTVDMREFFDAPYKLYLDVDHYDLEFFQTQKAIKCYTQYRRMLDVQDPDSPDALKRLQQGLKFVFGFCNENDLQLSEYAKFQTDAIPCFLDHLKTHKINFYVLHALTFSNPVVDSRILDFIFADFYGTFRKTRSNYYMSKTMKDFGKKAKRKIEHKLK